MVDAGGGVLRLSETSSGVAFWIHVTPRAKRTAVSGCHGDALRVAVTDPPVEGLANAACVRALAEALGVKRSEVELDPKSKGRRKRVRVSGESAALAARLGELAAESSSY
jgi:hypothetical protein